MYNDVIVIRFYILFYLRRRPQAMDIPGCVCGRGSGVAGSLSGSMGMSAAWPEENGMSASSSMSTSLLTKTKPFPIRGKCLLCKFSSCSLFFTPISLFDLHSNDLHIIFL